MHPRKTSRKTSLAALFLLALCPVLSAQSIWLSPRQTLSIEVLKPNLDGPDNTTFTTSTIFLTARARLSERLHFVGELPFVHGEITFAGNRPHDNFGNPYLGVELRRAASPVFAEAGVRLPLAHSDNFATNFVGFFSDVDRLEAFAVDNYAALFAINYESLDFEKFRYRLRAGSTLLMQTEQGTDPDAFVFFSAQAFSRIEAVELMAGVTGRFRLTRDRRLGQRSFLQAHFGAVYEIGAFRPGLHLTVPLEADLREILDFVFGVNLGVGF